MKTFEIRTQDIVTTQGTIEFKTYEPLLHQAEQLNEALKTVEVTEDTIQTNKKLVAAVRKEANKLDDMRKSVKKELLEPYSAFERRVKEIVETVKEGEDLIRTQVREFEQKERDEKFENLSEMLELRLRKYPKIQQYRVATELIITPSLLNKSVSDDKAELTIVETLETINKTLKTIESLEYSDEITAEYISHLDMQKAIETVQKRHVVLEQVREVVKKPEKVDYIITLDNSDDYIKVTKYLNENNITYK